MRSTCAMDALYGAYGLSTAQELSLRVPLEEEEEGLGLEEEEEEEGIGLEEEEEEEEEAL